MWLGSDTGRVIVFWYSWLRTLFMGLIHRGRSLRSEGGNLAVSRGRRPCRSISLSSKYQVFTAWPFSVRWWSDIVLIAEVLATQVLSWCFIPVASFRHGSFWKELGLPGVSYTLVRSLRMISLSLSLSQSVYLSVCLSLCAKELTVVGRCLKM